MNQLIGPEFRENEHWLFKDEGSRVLWVFFSTAARNSGSFNLYKASRDTPGDKLFFADPNNDYYLLLQESICAKITDVLSRKRYERVIFWGSSMGGFGAMLFGGLFAESANGYIYAFAPQLALDHKETHATHYIKDARLLQMASADMRRNRSRELADRTHPVFPVIEAYDWPTVHDAICGFHSPHTVFTVTTHAVIENVRDDGHPDIVRTWLAQAYNAQPLEVPSKLIASDADVRVAALQYRQRKGMAITELDLVFDDRNVKSRSWFNAKMRVLESHRQFEEAIAAGIRSVDLEPDVAEYNLCLANCLNASGRTVYSNMAEGFYRNAYRLDPKDALHREALLQYLHDRGLGREGFAAIVDSREEPWWSERHEAFCASAPDLRDQEILLVGDSIFHNMELGPDASLGDYKSILSDIFDVSIYNNAFPGDRTDNVLWRLRGMTIRSDARCAIYILVGINDIYTDRPAEIIATGISLAVDEIGMKFRNSTVYVWQIFPAELSDRQEFQRLRLNTLLQNMAATKKFQTDNFDKIFFNSAGELKHEFFYDQQVGNRGVSLHPTKMAMKQVWEKSQRTLHKQDLK